MIDLKFDNVSKKYRIRHESNEVQSGNGFVRKLRGLVSTTEDFWAVKDVSFDVKKGETLGIIGHNGAGKSTILKLLASITSPTKGKITINGRLSALIEVGSGFHPELTGRENIYLNGSILGMRRSEITRKLDSIVEFAGLSQFLDTPVKRFSSGMYVRLGFSIAAHLDPDILLLDEVLAVGDASFQAKCLERINELKLGGTTIVFISHDLGAIEQICDRVMLMSGGQIVGNGSPADMISLYRNQSPTQRPVSANLSNARPGENSITSLVFSGPDGDLLTEAKTGFPLQATVDFIVEKTIEDGVLEVTISTPDSVFRCMFTTDIDPEKNTFLKGRNRIIFKCPELPLLPGIYHAGVYLKERDDLSAHQSLVEAAVLRVLPGKEAHGEFYIPQSWNLNSHEVLDKTV